MNEIEILNDKFEEMARELDLSTFAVVGVMHDGNACCYWESSNKKELEEALSQLVIQYHKTPVS
jgi:hypothetical protein